MCRCSCGSGGRELLAAWLLPVSSEELPAMTKGTRQDGDELGLSCMVWYLLREYHLCHAIVAGELFQVMSILGHAEPNCMQNPTVWCCSSPFPTDKRELFFYEGILTSYYQLPPRPGFSLLPWQSSWLLGWSCGLFLVRWGCQFLFLWPCRPLHHLDSPSLSHVPWKQMKACSSSIVTLECLHLASVHSRSSWRFWKSLVPHNVPRSCISVSVCTQTTPIFDKS